MQETVARGLDLEDTLYESPGGPVMVLDVLYGHGVQIERSGQDFFAHKTGFTRKSLLAALQRAGFSLMFNTLSRLEVDALAFKGTPDPATRALLGV